LTQRSDLPPLAGVLKKHGIDLATFFRLFPRYFRVIGTKVLYWQIEEDEDIVEQRSMPKDAPYTQAGWRDIGVTSHMLLGLAHRLARPVHVIHGDRKVFTFTPPGWEEAVNKDYASAIVYNVWSDHAFFYRAPAARAASHNARAADGRAAREVPRRPRGGPAEPGAVRAAAALQH
jgi:hypothetical protein